MRRLSALIAAAVLICAGPALAGPKDVKSTLKAWETQCVEDAVYEGLSKKKARKLCKCSKKEVSGWIGEAEGDEKALRIWAIYHQSDPAESDAEYYRQAVEAGLDKAELTGLVVSMFYDEGQFFEPCLHALE